MKFFSLWEMSTEKSNMMWISKSLFKQPEVNSKHQGPFWDESSPQSPGWQFGGQMFEIVYQTAKGKVSKRSPLIGITQHQRALCSACEEWINRLNDTQNKALEPLSPSLYNKLYWTVWNYIQHVAEEYDSFLKLMGVNKIEIYQCRKLHSMRDTMLIYYLTVKRRGWKVWHKWVSRDPQMTLPEHLQPPSALILPTWHT